MRSALLTRFITQLISYFLCLFSLLDNKSEKCVLCEWLVLIPSTLHFICIHFASSAPRINVSWNHYIVVRARETKKRREYHNFTMWKELWAIELNRIESVFHLFFVTSCLPSSLMSSTMDFVMRVLNMVRIYKEYHTCDVMLYSILEKAFYYVFMQIYETLTNRKIYEIQILKNKFNTT